MRAIRSVAVALALLLPLTAHADPRDDARRHFRAGLEAARDGDYELALERFLAAQETYPHPVTLYNIARAYQDLGDLDNAIATYELFREASPERAEDVDPILAVLRAQRDAASAPAPASTPAEPSSVTATAGEVERLRALMAEMEALVDGISQAAEPVEPPVVNTEPVGPTDPTPGIAPPDFEDDAYERVVVTASRFGQSPLDSPSTLSVITSEDIRLSGLTNIPDLLRRVAGVEAMAKSAGHTDISIRGFNRELSNKVLVLVDGRSTTWDFLGTTLWNMLPITIEEIDRIEIIRGPGSAIYGANAVTGVVNIITRTPGEGSNVATVQAGTPGVLGGSALITGRADADAWRLSVGWQEHDRWGRATDLTPESSQVGFFDDQQTALRTLRASGRVDHSFLDKGLLSMSAGFSDAKVETYNIGVLGDYGYETTHVMLRTDVGYGPFVLRAFWNHDDSRNPGRADPLGNHDDSRGDANYLHRPLLPAIVSAVAPGGLLLYETFALGNERFGKPSNPDYLLKPEELLAAVAGTLRVLAYEDIVVEQPKPAAIQHICARRDA